jgi:DNA repair exonuclease SbcCD ATPase subunit
MENEQTNQTEQTNEEPSNPKEQVEKVRESMKKQITEERNARLELEKQLEQRNQQEQEQEDERLKANEEYKALLEKREEELRAKDELLQTTEQSLTQKYNELLQDNAIVKMGITDEIQILGLKAKYSRAEDAPDFSEWLTAQNIDTKPTGKSSGTVGSISTKTNDPVNVPLTHAEARNMTREQKAQARQALRDRARGIVG